MGFDVTAVSIIFFVAIVSAGSAWMGAYWKSNESTNEATRAQQSRADEAVHTNLSVSSATYDAGNTRFTVDLKNTGSTVVDVSDMTYLIDGVLVTATSIESAVVLGHATSDILLPGETLEAKFNPVSSSPSHFKGVSGAGVAGYWGS